MLQFWSPNRTESAGLSGVKTPLVFTSLKDLLVNFIKPVGEFNLRKVYEILINRLGQRAMCLTLRDFNRLLSSQVLLARLEGSVSFCPSLLTQVFFTHTP